MNRFAPTVAQKIREASLPSEVADLLIAAADCLSKVHVENFGSSEYPEIDRNGVTVEDAGAIEEALLTLYRRNPNADGIATVLWALTKARDPELQPLFLEHAEIAMRKPTCACVELGHALSGLEDFSAITYYEKIRSEMYSEIIDKADAYLRRAGVLVPLG